MLDQISLYNRGQKTREAESELGTYVIGASCDQRLADDTAVQDIVLLKTNLGLPANLFLSRSLEKVTAVVSKGKLPNHMSLNLNKKLTTRIIRW